MANEQDGQVRIADDVVAVIAGIAATETDGIAGMSGAIYWNIAHYVALGVMLISSAELAD